MQITFINSRSIRHKGLGLNEPSGLCLTHDKAGFWTISDDTKAIFRLSIEIQSKPVSFPIEEKGLEGITMTQNGDYLLAVKEETNEILKLHSDCLALHSRHPLATMLGYEKVQKEFRDSNKNKGLEGITLHTRSGTVLTIKEGDPGLLIEISENLTHIQNVIPFRQENGFIHPDLDQHAIDYSDLCYDKKRDLLWIVSDKGRCIFLYNHGSNKVMQKLDLIYQKDGKNKTIPKAEGIAIDPSGGKLFIVSDSKARLYTFTITD